MGFGAVKNALLQGNIAVLTPERVEALLEIVPTEEELAKVAAYQLSEGEKLGEAERFFLEVGGVSRLEQRLLILRMRHSFSSTIGALKLAVKGYHQACLDVMHSEPLRGVLEITLALGNTFNGQKAVGARLTSLLEFLTMKAPGDQRISMLHYLCDILKAKRPELYDFSKGIPALVKPPPALDLIEVELQALKSQIDLATRELSLQGKAQGGGGNGETEDSFYTAMETFCQRATAGVYEIEEEWDAMTETVQVTSLYLGEASLTMDDLFAKLSKFATDYSKAQKEHAKLIRPEMAALLAR